MTGFLQRRLDTAREERRQAAARAAGIATRAFGPEPQPEPKSDGVVIDLRTVWSVRDAAQASRRARTSRALVPVQGAGSGAGPHTTVATTSPAQERCPRCGGSVRLDMFDAVEAVAHLTCLDCSLLFTARSPSA